MSRLALGIVTEPVGPLFITGAERHAPPRQIGELIAPRTLRLKRVRKRANVRIARGHPFKQNLIPSPRIAIGQQRRSERREHCVSTGRINQQ